MFRPSARIAKAQALAAASMSPPLRSISGKAMRARVMAVRIARRRCTAVVWPIRLPMALPACAFARASSIGSLRLADHHAAEQAGGTEDQDDDQDREDNDIGPAGRQQLPAERLDEPDDDAAQHGPG